MSVSKIVLNILSICISILIFVLVIFGIVKLGHYFYDMGYRVFTEKPMEPEPGRDVVMEITEGMSNRDIGERMEEKRLVDNGSLAAIQLFLFTGENKIQPGRYTLNTSQTLEEMLTVITAVPGEETEDLEEGESPTSEETGTEAKSLPTGE